MGRRSVSGPCRLEFSCGALVGFGHDGTVELVVRPARVEEVEEILDVFEATASEGIWIGSEAPLDRDVRQPAFRSTIETMESGGPDALFVAEVGGRIVGSVGLHSQQRGVLGLGIQIEDGHRGRGFGSAMVDAAVTWARGRGDVHKIVLDHFPWNHAGRIVYERAGFVEEGYHRRHHRRRDGSLWDSVAMGLVLDDESPGHDVRAAEPPGR